MKQFAKFQPIYHARQSLMYISNPWPFNYNIVHCNNIDCSGNKKVLSNTNAWSGNRTRVYRVAGGNYTTKPTMLEGMTLQQNFIFWNSAAFLAFRK